MLLTQIKMIVTSKEMDCEFQAYDNCLEFLCSKVHKILATANQYEWSGKGKYK